MNYRGIDTTGDWASSDMRLLVGRPLETQPAEMGWEIIGIWDVATPSRRAFPWYTMVSIVI